MCSQNKKYVEWRTVNIGQYILELPDNYSIAYFSEDSTVGKIKTDKDSYADFSIGYFMSSVIDKQEGKVLRNDTLKSYITKIILKTSNIKSDIYFYSQDTTHTTPIFGDKRIMGIVITARGLDKDETDVLLKVLNTVKLKIDYVKEKELGDVI